MISIEDNFSKKSTALAFARSSLASMCACTDTEEDSLSNCSLNVSAASLDFLQTGLETFWLLVFPRKPMSFCCYEAATSILKYHLLCITSESPLLFAHRRALCSCMLHMSIQKDIANLHHSDKDLCIFGDHGAVYNVSESST